MSKQRPSIPREVRDSVLREFSHRCAICGADNPHLHHLDENPENNDPLNLLPLCPNHHLTDQHNPTRRHDPKKLRLFRIYKDPTILSPQFEALFERMGFLDVVKATFDPEAVERCARELVQFVRQLEMGEFYGAKLGELLGRPAMCVVVSSRDPVDERRDRENETRWSAEYLQQVINGRPMVEKLVVELLRFQSWRDDDVPAEGKKR
jgi:hypothetical protein